MSRDWTKEEIQAASEAMQAMGHMSYETFCKEFDATRKIQRFAPLQRKYHWPCPRCGRWVMNSDPARNALSRRAEIYVCDQCGIEEAMEDFTGKVTPLSSWDIAKQADWPLGAAEAEDE